MGTIGRQFEAVYNVVSKYESDERLLETICKDDGYNKFIGFLTGEGVDYQIAKSFILPVLFYGDFPRFCAEVQKSDFGMEYKGAVYCRLSCKD